MGLPRTAQAVKWELLHLHRGEPKAYGAYGKVKDRECWWYAGADNDGVVREWLA